MHMRLLMKVAANSFLAKAFDRGRIFAKTEYRLMGRDDGEIIRFRTSSEMNA